MGQCVIKDCGFNIQNKSETQQRDLKEFLKERLKDRYSSSQKTILSNSRKFESSPPIKGNNVYDNENYDSSIEEGNYNKKKIDSQLQIQHEETEYNEKIPKKDSTNISSSTRNLQKFKDLTLNESFLRNKHFFTPKTSEEEQTMREIKDLSKNEKKIRKSNEDIRKLEQNFKKSNTLKNEQIDKKNQNQNGSYQKFFNPISVQSPEQQTPTPTKVEFGNIFTEEELSNASGDLHDFEKKFPQELIEKYSKKSKKSFN